MGAGGGGGVARPKKGGWQGSNRKNDNRTMSQFAATVVLRQLTQPVKNLLLYCLKLYSYKSLEPFFEALSSSARWVRSTLLSFCTVHLKLSSVVLSKNIGNIERIQSLGTPRIKPVSAWSEARTVSIVLSPPYIEPCWLLTKTHNGRILKALNFR